MPTMPSNSGAEFYGPGGASNTYDKLQSQPGLPGVSPPTGASTGAPPPAAFVSSSPVDPDAPDVLNLIKGGRFKTPVTITLMRREGMQVFKSDAGVKREAAFVFCKETIREPSDLLRLGAGITAGVYKPLNNMTLEFQLMMYLAHENNALDVPPQPVVVPQPEETKEATEEATAEA